MAKFSFTENYLSAYNVWDHECPTIKVGEIDYYKNIVLLKGINRR